MSYPTLNKKEMLSMLKGELVIGKRYVVKTGEGIHWLYNEGDILTYTDDDGTDYPQFFNERTLNTVYCYAGRLNPYDPIIFEEDVCEDMTIPMEQKQAAELPNQHYQTAIQPIEAMQANMTPEEFQGYLKGSIMKYTCRMGRKDAPLKEAKKIEDFSRWLRLAIEGKIIDPRKD